MFRIIAVTYKKNRQSVKRALPWGFIIGRIIGGVSAVLFPYIIYKYFFNSTINNSFVKYTGSNDYITYIVIGASFFTLSVATLMNIGRALITEMRDGTLEVILLTPASRLGYLIGTLLEQLSRTVIEFGTILVIGAILGANIVNIFKIEALFVLLLAVTTLFCISLCLSSFMLYSRDTYISQNTLFNLIFILCGISFPVNYLPQYAQLLSYIFPLTQVLELYRKVVISNENIIFSIESIIQILILSAVYFTIGIVLLKKIEKKFYEDIFA